MWSPAVARAVNCIVQGTIRIESMDTYYCDPDVGADCSGWKEDDLDNRLNFAQRMRYSHTLITDTNDAVLAQTYTNNVGFYSATISLPACTGLVRVHSFLVRVDPVNFPLAGYFRISENSAQELTLGSYKEAALTGSTTTIDRRINASSDPTPVQRAATVYHTANSAIEVIRGWSTNLANRLWGTFAIDGSGMPRICYDDSPVCVSSGAVADAGLWKIKLSYGSYSYGSIVRHEIGHLAHAALHHRNGTSACYSTDMLLSPNHPVLGCEYGMTAFNEAFADFVAVSSIVTTVDSTNGNGAFLCKCASADNSNQDRCSDTAVAATTTADPDRIVPATGCGEGTFIGFGDAFATTNHCARVRPGRTAYGCECLDSIAPFDGKCDDYPTVPEMCRNTSPVDLVCDDWVDLGWRNTAQIGRFLWDELDANNESSWDDDDLSMGDIAAALEAMDCTVGIDHSCNEPNTSPCNPATAGPLVQPPTPNDATRDSRNVADIAWHLENPNGSGTTILERVLNCVDEVVD
jgi:hypothetical protein